MFYTLCVDWFFVPSVFDGLGLDSDSELRRFGGEPLRTSDSDGAVHGLASCGIHSEELLTSTHFTRDTDKNITQKSTRVVKLWTEL